MTWEEWLICAMWLAAIIWLFVLVLKIRKDNED